MSNNESDNNNGDVPFAQDQAPRVPVHRLAFGRIQAAIWRNDVRDGIVSYSVTFRRAWRDDRGNWHDSTNFGRDDLLPLSKLASDAFAAIHHIQRRDRSQEQSSSDNEVDEPTSSNPNREGAPATVGASRQGRER